MSKLKDRLVIVTVAAPGTGRAIAVEAARQGAAWVTLADIQEDAGRAAVAEVEPAGAKARCNRTDLSVTESVRNMIDETTRLAGITDDGLLGRAPTVKDFPKEVWNKVMRTNLKEMWLPTRFATHHLRKSRRCPAILNGTSVVATVAYPGPSSYATSKAVFNIDAGTLARRGVR